MACSHKNALDAKFCSTCGVSLERILCRCGSVLTQKVGHCSQCGQSVEALFVTPNSILMTKKSNKISLKALIQSVEVQKIGSVSAGHEVASVNQDDIDELFD